MTCWEVGGVKLFVHGGFVAAPVRLRTDGGFLTLRPGACYK